MKVVKILLELYIIDEVYMIMMIKNKKTRKLNLLKKGNLFFFI